MVWPRNVVPSKNDTFVTVPSESDATTACAVGSESSQETDDVNDALVCPRALDVDRKRVKAIVAALQQ